MRWLGNSRLAMRTSDSEWIDRTYYQLRSLAKDYWKVRTGSDNVRTDIWERYHATFRHPVLQAVKTVEDLTPDTLSDAVSDGVFAWPPE